MLLFLPLFYAWEQHGMSQPVGLHEKRISGCCLNKSITPARLVIAHCEMRHWSDYQRHPAEVKFLKNIFTWFS